jgi:hypothetical protein
VKKLFTVTKVRTGFWPFYKYADQKMLQAGLAEAYIKVVVLSHMAA